MQSRWFHKPHLHSPSPGEERKASWLELFYDLIYVASIIQLGNGLADHIGWIGFLTFAGLFVPLWFTWSAVTFFNNRFIVDDVLHRLLVLVQMFFVGIIAMGVPGVFEGDPTTFALGYIGARVVVLILYLRVALQADGARELGRLSTIGYSISLVFWIAGLFVPTPWVFLLWGVGVFLEAVIPLNKYQRELNAKYPPDIELMSERYGLLVIIVLGESFVKILGAVADAGLTFNIGMMWAMTMVVTASMWWIYFDDVAGSKIKTKIRGGTVIWVYAHLPLTIAVTAVGVANKKVAFFDPFVRAPGKYGWLLCGTLGLAFLSVAAIDYVAERRHSQVSDRSRIIVRLASSVAIIIIGVVANALDAMWFVGIIAVFCAAQVVFDLFAAPEMLTAEEHGHEDHDEFEFPEHKNRKEKFAGHPRRDISEAVRVGTPNELRRDLYFQFMEASWVATFIAFVAIFIFTNVIFAAIYCLDPEGVTNVSPQSFADAFWFSVQTITTIGYGTMSPVSNFAQTVVTIQSILGILGVAICTGVFFAKASRPSSSMLFSKPMVITQDHGERTLMFRVGNARGNEVVEASMTVSAIVSIVTPEGNRFRKVIDLPLVRSSTPLFTLSWTVMHVIDEDSPLFEMTDATIEDEMYGIICTMMGYDPTYGQHTHARYTYHPEHIYFDRTFVDVIDTLDDGRLRLDYRKFHDTVDAIEQAERHQQFLEEE